MGFDGILVITVWGEAFGQVMGSIAPLFFEGSHREVLERSIDSPHPTFDLEDFPFVVGALVMLGRIEEAEMTYTLRQQQLTPSQQVAARFFLGIGFCRHSYYDKSRAYFVENVNARRIARDPISRFYRFQGLGFYHYFAGRMNRALKAVQRSFSAALEAQFLYGRAFAADLKGHTLVLTGEVSEGLRTLGLAEHLAEQLGARWLQETIQSSVLTYRVQYGVEGENSVARLQERLQALSKQDIYTQSTLLLELAQAYFREGKLSAAREALNDCCRIVYGSKNRRHTALLNLRYANAHYLEGEPHLALNLVRNAVMQIDSRVDRCLELRLRGFERKLVTELKLPTCTKVLNEKVAALTLQVGEETGRRMMAREHSPHFLGGRVGEDLIGDLWDRIRRAPESAVDEILKRRYYGLLAEVLPVPRGGQVLYLDLEPGSLTVFDKGNIEHHADAVSRSLRALLVELQQGPRTKEELIERVWKYRYHPLRHDALIYSAIAKLRKTLGSRSHWVEASELGYQLRLGIAVQSMAAPEPVARVMDRLLPESGPDLNSRQQKILRFLHENEFIDTQTCRRLFETSEITASRDLSDLLKLDLIERTGKGRATKYSRRVNHNQGAHT